MKLNINTKKLNRARLLLADISWYQGGRIFLNLNRSHISPWDYELNG